MQVSSRINSTKHGITSSNLLNCKKDSCIYYNLCHVKEAISTYPYGAFCPIEVVKRKDIEEAYTKDLIEVSDPIKTKIIRDLVMIDLQEMRIDQLVSVTCAVPGVSGEADRLILPHVLQRYHSELIGKRIKLYKQVRELKLSASKLTSSLSS